MSDSPPRLCQAEIGRLAAAGMDVPLYARSGVSPGVVHLGLGAFQRAHQAMVFDEILRAGDRRWAVCAVATRSVQLADTLAAQDGLYAVKLASSQGESWHMVGAVVQTCSAKREPRLVHAAIASPGTRWLTLTVTEKGYDADLATLLLDGLHLRLAAGLGGLTIASCDNLSHNGDKLKELLANACDDDALLQWLQVQCRFPNSMVDRIVPAATSQCVDEAAIAWGVEDKGALFTEQFSEWVIEDNFVDPSDGQLLAKAGVTVVPDVGPYEAAKLRMLNGSHSALACIGAVMGLATVFDAVMQAQIRQFIQQLMTYEVMPYLARPGLADYRDALLERFGNPAIKHSLHQIATDSSKKISLRWVPSILDQLQHGGRIEHLAFASAAWMRYCLGQDDAGKRYAIHDPQAELLGSLAKQLAGHTDGAITKFLALPGVWGPALPTTPAWCDAVTSATREILQHGMAGALGHLLAADPLRR